jgi:hypothetical protein
VCWKLAIFVEIFPIDEANLLQETFAIVRYKPLASLSRGKLTSEDTVIL